MSESMRDRLLAACYPWDYSVRPGATLAKDPVARSAAGILARVLAVLADPDDETVDAVSDAIFTDVSWLASSRVSRAALAALVEYLREPQ